MKLLNIKPQRLQSLEMYKWFDLELYGECNYLSVAGLKLIRVSKMGPWKRFFSDCCDPILDSKVHGAQHASLYIRKH